MSNASSSSSPIEQPKKSTPISGVPWNPWLAVVFVVVVYFASQIIAALGLSLYAGVQHWPRQQAEDWLSTSIYAQFFYVVIAEGLVLGALYKFLKLYRRSWSSIGFRRPKWSDLGIGLLIAPLYYVTYVVIIGVASWLVPSINVDQTQQLGFSPAGSGQLIVTFISLVILPPLVEETLMRGYLYTSLKKGLPQMAAALLTSVIFASAHLQAGSGAPLLWVAAIDTFVLSLFLIWLREKTGSLWASMTLHALKNGIAFITLFILHLT
jgi:membrane protease YdiL (CAAX protease family)